jgi:lipoprotein-anchoring transpeptidase ErfK/SrfK
MPHRVRRPRPRVPGARLMSAALVVLALGLTSACNGPGAQWRLPGGSTGSTDTPGPGASALVLSPDANATGVSPADPVTAQLIGGALDSVSLINPDGKSVKGEYDSAKTTWHNAEDLGYNKKYTFKASGVGADGKRLEEARTFTTVKPKNYTLPYLRANVTTLLDGGTFGVGQPVVVWFDENIPDRAAAERTLSVTTTPPVVGAWHWYGTREVHWRPKEYWPKGTQVSVAAKVYGRNLGSGLYGQEDVTANFTIGPSRIAIADSNTHHMKIYVDGVEQKTINGKSYPDGVPISMGRGGSTTGANGVYVDFHTNSGPHYVLDKEDPVEMSSASFGITDPSNPFYYPKVVVHLAVRISVGGEFVHSAPWSVAYYCNNPATHNKCGQGYTNVSHGCINVSPSVADWFFSTFTAGDVVDVRNTGRDLGTGKNPDGPNDWVLTWEKWLKGSALPLPVPSPTPSASPSASPSPSA